MGNFIKQLKFLLPTLVVITLLGGLIRVFSLDQSFSLPLWLTSSWIVLKSILYFLLIISAILLILYVPPIVLIRKWWKGYRKRHHFKNDQNEKSIQRFVNNATALFGIVTIVYAFILATVGYLVAPDPSPDANNQINELSLIDPGFSTQILKVRFNREEEKVNFFKRVLSGKPSNHKYIPINHYWFKSDSVFATRYRGENVAGDTLKFDLADVVYAKSFEKKGNIVKGDDLQFFDLSNNPVNTTITSLQSIIKKENIITRKFLFGTDNLGRDYLSRMIIGVRVSVSVGFIAVFIALLIGIPMGSVGGFYRGRIDDVIMWLINVFWSIPTLLLVFPIVFAFGQQFWTIYVAVGLTMWVDIARIVRGQVLSVRELEYIDAAKAFGFSNFRTIVYHILPNISGPVIVITAANFAYAILIEAGLSFLGIGVQPPKPSWGLMISKHKDYIVTGDPHLALIPGFAIVLLVLAFFLIGNGLRDALDAKTNIDH